VTQVRIAELHSAIGTDGAFARGLSRSRYGRGDHEAYESLVAFVRFALGAERRETVERRRSLRPRFWAWLFS